MNEIQPTLLTLDPPAARAFEALAEYFWVDGPVACHAALETSERTGLTTKGVL